MQLRACVVFAFLRLRFLTENWPGPVVAAPAFCAFGALDLVPSLGQVPVLQLADGTFLRESSAILMHLAEGTSLLPAEKIPRTHVLEWMCIEQSNVSPVIGRARFKWLAKAVERQNSGLMEIKADPHARSAALFA